jgi:hypothetical protein
MPVTADSVHTAQARLKDEPHNAQAVFHDFCRAFCAEVAAKYGSRPREVVRPYYGDAAPFGAADVARLAKGVALTTARDVARAVAEETCATALAVAFEDEPDGE